MIRKTTTLLALCALFAVAGAWAQDDPAPTFDDPQPERPTPKSPPSSKPKAPAKNPPQTAKPKGGAQKIATIDIARALQGYRRTRVVEKRLKSELEGVNRKLKNERDAISREEDDLETAERGTGLPEAGLRIASPPADFRPMYEGCRYLQRCYADRRRLAEADWEMALKLASEASWAGHSGRHVKSDQVDLPLLVAGGTGSGTGIVSLRPRWHVAATTKSRSP